MGFVPGYVYLWRRLLHSLQSSWAFFLCPHRRLGGGKVAKIIKFRCTMAWCFRSTYADFERTALWVRAPRIDRAGLLALLVVQRLSVADFILVVRGF